MALTRRAWVWTLSAVIAGGAVATAGAAWAITSSHSTAAPGGQNGSGAGDSTPGTVPALYTGDELTWLLLPDDKLRTLLGVSEHIPAASDYRTGGEREGTHTEPVECDGLWFDDDIGVIGYRSIRWGGDVIGEISVRQFPSPAQAQGWASPRMDTFSACMTTRIVTYKGDDLNSITLSDAVDVSKDQARAVAYEVTYAKYKNNSQYVRAVMVQGNVVVTVNAPDSDAQRIDKNALVQALLAQAASARTQLTE